MSHAELVESMRSEIFRVDALLKVIRVAAFDKVERKDDPCTLLFEDFPNLLDVTIDRLKLVNEKLEMLESELLT